VRAGRQHTADQVVGELRGRQVEDAADEPGLDQALHAPSAGARGVEDEHLVPTPLQLLPRGGDRRRGDTEHGGRDDRARRAVIHRRRGDHAGHGGGGIREDPRGDRVEPGHVRDGGHQDHVADVHVGAGVAGGHRRHDELGHPDGQRPHGGGRDRGVARPACGEHALAAPLVEQPTDDLRSSRAHRLHGGTAIGQGGQLEPARCGHVLAPHVGRGARRSLGPDVDEQGGDAGPLEPFAQERVLLPLGVEGADEDDGRGTHGRTSLPLIGWTGLRERVAARDGGGSPRSLT
jgi:hypothetical protein